MPRSAGPRRASTRSAPRSLVPTYVMVDGLGSEVTRGTIGELWIAGPMMVPGYWQIPEGHGRTFSGGYWHSGDIGSLDAEGYVRVLDRMKDLINRGGYKVYCIEVENVLGTTPTCSNAR